MLGQIRWRTKWRMENFSDLIQDLEELEGNTVPTLAFQYVDIRFREGDCAVQRIPKGFGQFLVQGLGTRNVSKT